MSPSQATGSHPFRYADTARHAHHARDFPSALLIVIWCSGQKCYVGSIWFKRLGLPTTLKIFQFGGTSLGAPPFSFYQVSKHLHWHILGSTLEITFWQAHFFSWWVWLHAPRFNSVSKPFACLKSLGSNLLETGFWQPHFCSWWDFLLARF